MELGWRIALTIKNFDKPNLSYFGKKNDEANWIYNFTLPPLLIHAFIFEDSSKLNQWMKKLPSTKLKNNYFNFIASHDGIGMRPAEGYLNKHTLNKLFKRLFSNNIFPLSIFSNPAIILNKVDLPQPEGPNNTRNLPFSTFRLNLLITLFFPKDLSISSNSKKGIFHILSFF